MILGRAGKPDHKFVARMVRKAVKAEPGIPKLQELSQVIQGVSDYENHGEIKNSYYYPENPGSWVVNNEHQIEWRQEYAEQDSFENAAEGPATGWIAHAVGIPREVLKPRLIEMTLGGLLDTTTI